MSEIVNEATIKVVADASGVETGLRKVTEHTADVEAGLKRVDDTAKKTGRTLENLSSGPGLRNVGEGAGAAAGQVDRATKNMADSIQRATATMSAGAKGSREYFESLANSRGINVAALQPYLAQLDAVTRKTALAAEAQRQLEASNRFLDGLRSQAEGIGKTASQMAALRAEQLGVTDAARPMIEQLRAAEEAAGDAEGSFGNFASALAAVGFGGGIAAISQISDEYGKYVSQLKLATVGQTEFANAQVAVRRIATSAQSDLSATGALFASISKSTRELGLAQRQIADITETVSLALKVSGASGEEASSAILQLSQAFASGTLRGDEFNSVNEAAPRLMQALADGLGVPIGALRKMAEEGELTTTILSGALPRALGELRNEALSVQTIGGAFTVLKNNVMEAVGATAQSSGVVKLFSGAIGLLADNLTLAAGAAATFAAVKIGTALSSAATQALATASANRALALSSLEAARSNVAATAAASALAAARVAELRAAVAAAEGNVALAITTNGLIPAQARATAAAAAHTAALSAQAAAAGSASVAGGVLRGALGLLGGPVGAVIALLGLGATAWAVWGDSSKKAGEQASESVKASTEEVLEGLDKQISKLRERNRLASAGFKPAEIQSPGGERLGEVMAQIDRAGRGQGEYASLSLDARTEILKVLGRQYGDLTAKIAEFNRESEIDTANRSAKSAGEWMQKYATSAEKMNAELEKAKKDLGAAFTPELEARIRKQYDETSKGAAKAEDAYKSLIVSINEKIKASAAEARGLAPLTQSAKEQIALDEQLLSGKLKLTPAQKASYEAKIKELSANESLIASNKRLQESEANYTKGRVAAEGDLKSIAEQVKAQEQANEQIGLTGVALAALVATRLEDAAALKEETAAALEAIEPGSAVAQTYRDQAAALRDLAAAKQAGARKQVAADGAKQAAEDWKRTSAQIEQSLTDALLRGFESGKGFGQNLVDTIKNMFNTLVLRPIVSAVVNPIAGAVTSALGMSGMASAATGGISGAGSVLSSASGLSNFASIGGSAIAGIGNFVGSSTMSAFGAGFAGSTGGMAMTASETFASMGMAAEASAASIGSLAAAALPWVAGLGVALALWKKFDTSGTYHTGGASSASASGTQTIRAESIGFQNTKVSNEVNDMTAQLARGVVGILDSTAATFGKTAGYTAATAFADDTSKDGAWGSLVIKNMDGTVLDWNATRNSKWAPKEFADSDKGKEQYLAEMSKSVRAALDGIGLPSWAKTMMSALDSNAGLEEIAQVAQQINQTQNALKGMGQQMSIFANLSDGVATKLIAAAGGIESLANSAAAYYQSFYSDTEKTAAVIGQIGSVLASVGLSVPATKAEFRALVEANMALGEAGAKTVAALLSVSGAFAEIKEAVGETTTDLSSYRSKLTEAYNAESEALKSTIDRMGSFATSLRDLRKSALLGSLSPLSPQQKYAEARAQYEAVAKAARGGDEKAQDRYQDVYTAFLEASRLVNASSAGYRQDFDYAQAMTAEVAKWAGDQVDVGQAQLDVLKSQVSEIIEINTSVLSVRDALLQYNAALAQQTSPLPVVTLPPTAPIKFYEREGWTNNAALAMGLSLLREEVAGLRSDQRTQTGDQIAKQAEAVGDSAVVIARAITSSRTPAQERVRPE